VKADPKEAVRRFDATIAIDREERCGQLASLSSGETPPSSASIDAT
jgi:hypothetical protein